LILTCVKGKSVYFKKNSGNSRRDSFVSVEKSVSLRKMISVCRGEFGNILGFIIEAIFSRIYCRSNAPSSLIP
jgi:hypothetical protein